MYKQIGTTGTDAIGCGWDWSYTGTASATHTTMYYDVNVIIGAVKTNYTYSGISQKQTAA